jgi:hypothetical protein
MATQDRELVAEDEDLQVFGGITAGEQHEQLDGAAQRELGEVRQHQGDLAVGGPSATLPSRGRRELAASQPASEFAHPTAEHLAAHCPAS